jgi:aspartate racemase
MRTVGLLGGMTWHSTVEYYRLINEGIQKRLGGSHSARCILQSFDFAPLEQMQERGEWAALGVLLAEAARRMADAGAEGLVICANTMHRLADDVTAAVRIPLIHIADAAAAAVKRSGLRRVGLLGTRFTMEMDFYRCRLEKNHGLDVLVPDEKGRRLVHDIIYRELGLGVVREESRRVYVAEIEKLAGRGAEGIILGCTEIPLLIGPDDVRIPLFDTTALHAAAAVDFALSE